MTDTMTPTSNGTGFSAPVRNRYFYGKLLDVHHLEMEQRYFLETSRLINRLTLGSGVLCGLRVDALDDGRVAVSPGVAVDGWGREIVVTERVVLDLAELDREGGEARAATPGRAGTVLCLSYHECDVEPSPVLVADCELREDCVPGAVRERFKFELMDAGFAPFPEDPCSILGREQPADDLPGPREAGLEERLRDSLESRLGAERAMAPVRAGAPRRAPLAPVSRGPGLAQGALGRPHTAEALRERLCAAFHPPCGPGPTCVPVALIERGEGDALAVRECPPRRTIYSNAVLLDLILCLWERVEACCDRRITLDAPKVVDTWPAPGENVTFAAFGKAPLSLDAGGIAVSFDREMNRQRLEAPDEWLRLMIVPDLAQTIGVPFELELDRVEGKTLSGDTAGQTAYYKAVGASRSGPLGDMGPAAERMAERAAAGDVPAITLEQLLEVTKAGSARALVLMRSDDVTQIAAKDDAELLDADFHGTGLTAEECDLLWTLQAISVAFGGLVKTALAAPPVPMPTLPSGNGIEGGVFHSSFEITGGKG